MRRAHQRVRTFGVANKIPSVDAGRCVSARRRSIQENAIRCWKRVKMKNEMDKERKEEETSKWRNQGNRDDY